MLIALFGWMAWTVQHVSVDVAVMKSQIDSVIKERFTAQEGRRMEDRLHRTEEEGDPEVDPAFAPAPEPEQEPEGEPTPG